MIRSMTGYGQGSNEAGSVRFQVEARSVNHRFLDLRLRLPSGYQCCEKDARALVRSRIRRGRVEVSVSLDRGEEAGPGLQVDHPLVRSVLNASQDLKARYGLSGELDVATVLRLPGVLREESSTSGPQKAEKEALLQAVDRARRRWSRIGCGRERAFARKCRAVSIGWRGPWKRSRESPEGSPKKAGRS